MVSEALNGRDYKRSLSTWANHKVIGLAFALSNPTTLQMCEASVPTVAQIPRVWRGLRTISSAETSYDDPRRSHRAL